MIAGGVREEIQRAFILHRFDVWLGGPIVGLILSSVRLDSDTAFRATTSLLPQVCSDSIGVSSICGAVRSSRRW